ncbi:MAG: hypothetical protein KFW07_02875 [Mycoplasmataceae bacterium]|nr:hypothetical protein [Mycoplasmataceae bacterium]
MKLTIKKEQDKEKEYLVGFAKEVLRISENSEDWSNDGINTFLINLASKTPEGDKINLEFDHENEDPVYKHIVMLFKEFTDEYNKDLNNK